MHPADAGCMSIGVFAFQNRINTRLANGERPEDYRFIMKVEKVLYDRKGAAFALSISVRRLDYLIAAKALKTRRIGRKVLIPAGELRRFAQSDYFGSCGQEEATAA